MRKFETLDNFLDEDFIGDREEIYKKIFKGNHPQEYQMFKNPGYRGLSYLPYPKHIKEMMNKVAVESKKSI